MIKWILKMSHNSTDFNNDSSSIKSTSSTKIKTTDVNILLNRVRLDKKKTLKKKILFSILLATILSSLAAFFMI